MKRVLITGASSGIGRACAERFAADGWQVGLLARRENLLKEACGNLPHSWYVAGDYSNEEVQTRLAAAIRENGGELDAFVNCAGVQGCAGIVDSSPDEWAMPLKTMIGGAYLTSRTVIPFLKDGGRIVHVTSIHANRAEWYASAYGMAKAAINQFCRSLALELAPRGILVNAVAPGYVDAPMTIVNGENELTSERFIANYVKGDHLPLRRAGKPSEIAGVIRFLCSDDSSYMTGQVLTVDGGLTITF